LALADLELEPWTAVAVSGRVRPSLGDRSHQRLRSEGGVDSAFAVQAISGDPTQGEVSL
jgi:hypothetical protein